MTGRKTEWVFRAALVLVFLLGALGHLLLQAPSEPERPVTLTLFCEDVSAFLSYALPQTGSRVSVAATEGRLDALTRVPRSLVFRQNGRSKVCASRLSFSLYLTVSVPARVKEGRLYLGERMLLVGDEVVVSGKNALISARLTGF